MPNQDKLKELRKVIDDSTEVRDTTEVLLKTMRKAIIAGDRGEAMIKQFLHMQELDALHADKIIVAHEEMLLTLHIRAKAGAYNG